MQRRFEKHHGVPAPQITPACAAADPVLPVLPVLQQHLDVRARLLYGGYCRLWAGTPYQVCRYADVPPACVMVPARRLRSAVGQRTSQPGLALLYIKNLGEVWCTVNWFLLYTLVYAVYLLYLPYTQAVEI
jgi:hypothetical protein